MDAASSSSFDPAALRSLDDEAPAAADHAWHTVSYPKRRRQPPPPPLSAAAADPFPNGDVFASVDRKAAERRRALESAAAAAEAMAALARSRPAAAAESDEDDDDDSGAEVKENGEAEAPKKVKQKKPKTPKVTVAEAASKIDAEDLSTFLAEISVSFESQPDIQLKRFADYFARSFATVSSSQFPWTKMFKEFPVAKIADIPLCHITQPVYKTSVDWIAQKPIEALSDFILWCLDGILADLASQKAAAKASKKPAKLTPSKAQVAIFIVLGMTLRKKPDALINVLPKWKDNPKYQGQEKLPVIVWIISQASQGDPVVAMYSWVQYLLPLICGKSNVNPESGDLALQLVERILSGPKAQPILLNGVVRKGERLVPPSALDLLMRAAFPAPSARIQATERFESVYPTLKELALAGSPGTKATKQVSQQLLPYVVKAMQENNPELSKEATDVFIWCLTQNTECYRQWVQLHLENVEASICVLQRLSDSWKEYSVKLVPLEALRETIELLRVKNEAALSGTVEGNNLSIKEADKYCKVISRRLKRRSSCMKGTMCVLALAMAVGFLVSPNVESSSGWKKLHDVLNYFDP